MIKQSTKYKTNNSHSICFESPKVNLIAYNRFSSLRGIVDRATVAVSYSGSYFWTLDGYERLEKVEREEIEGG